MGFTLVADSDGTGVGFLVKIEGCANGGCETNSSALFKIQDDTQNSKHDGNCGQFDAFRDNSEDGDDNEDFFFIAFPMTAGNRGQSRQGQISLEQDADGWHLRLQFKFDFAGAGTPTRPPSE